MTKALHIQTPKNGQRLKPSHEFLCLGFADGIDPKVLQTVGHLSAHVAAHHHGHHRLHVCGLRIPAGALPPPPEGQRPYDWGFRFPVLPRVFHHHPSTIFARLIEDDGTVIDAEPHEVKWVPVFDAKISIGSPHASPPPVLRNFPATGSEQPATASVSAWASNTMEIIAIMGSPKFPPPPAGQWERDFVIPSDWGNQAGSITILYAQATDASGSQDTASQVITFS